MPPGQQPDCAEASLATIWSLVTGPANVPTAPAAHAPEPIQPLITCFTLISAWKLSDTHRFATQNGVGGAQALSGAEPPLTPAQAVKKIRGLEQEMHRLARNLEFEEAAGVRDQIAALRRASLGPESERLAG